MRVRVLLFAAARERAGAAELWLELPDGAPARAVVDAAVRERPALAGIAAMLRVAVNHALVDGETAIAEGDELALLPPVSGGAGVYAKISDVPLDLGRVIRAVSDEEHGAIATFAGIIRRHSHGRRVLRLDYEAYAPMAERVLAAIIAELVARSPSVRVAIEHRVGTLEVGELAVAIAVGAPHRREALTACAEAIDALKATAPIWKREHTDEGAEWVGCDHPRAGS